MRGDNSGNIYLAANWCYFVWREMCRVGRPDIYCRLSVLLPAVGERSCPGAALAMNAPECLTTG